MPLPNAKPEPAGSNVYRQLNSIKLGDLTNEQFDKVYQNVFLNDMSEDELRRLALVGQARQSFSESASGPIPKTSKIVQKVVTSSGGTPVLAFQPDPGQVWQFMGASSYATGNSGTIVYEVYISDDAVFSDTTAFELINYSNTSTKLPLLETNFPSIYLDENTGMYVEATGTFTDITFNLAFIRVR